MAVTVKKVQNKKELKAFIEYPEQLYRNNPYFCPKLYMDEMGTLSKDKNPAFEFCEADYFLAYKDGKPAGRVAAIVNRRANESWKHNEVRFGWIDFIDDPEVSAALIKAVEDFGRERGMDTVTGPLGFTDFDAEGMLVEGYDKLCTMPLIYNYPYYVKHIEDLGFQKETDWLEYKIHVPRVLPEKYVRVANLVKDRYGLKVKKLTRKEVFKEGWGKRIFDLINITYGSLYNFTNLTPGLIDKYIDTYLSLLDLKFVTVVIGPNDEIAGFGVMMPSIVRALQKGRGKLFPFGWCSLANSMYFKHEENLELLLIGILPEYQKKGVNALIFCDLFKTAIKYGFRYAETNAELEDNADVQTLWGDFDYEQHKRRRAYTKKL